MKPPTPPKGSLEDLFRHHLLESEAAAVPPRAHVWEQLDNSLLLAQNEQYRRRLRTHRWAIAASLLLASLTGGGWWHSQLAPAPTLATATPQAADRPGLAAARRAALAGPAANQARPTTATITVTPNLATANQAAIEETSTLAPVALPPTSLAGSAPAGPAAAAGRPQAAAARRATLALAPAGPGYSSAVSTAGAAAADLTGVSEAPVLAAASPKYGPPAGSLPPEAAADASPAAATRTLARASVVTDPAETAATPAGAADLLATRDANLALATVALPPSLDPVPVTMPLPELARQWQFGLGYAVSAFQPNIDFAKATATYGSFAAANAFATSSAVALARPATVEYRQALHHGLGQRLSLWATRRLGASRWGLRAGLELAQYSAGSAGSAVYEGGQVTGLAYTQALQPRAQRTTYRYRTASVSAEARYSNPVKSGFSLYGRVGALLTTLLSAHSEVQGVPEASSNYTLSSPSSPYRMLTGGLRGGGGLQYRPAGHQWALSLGPVAEMGILSLNTDSGQNFWHQARPYSFGLEAGLELGRSPRVP